MTTVQSAPFVEYTDKLRSMAGTLRDIALASPNVEIDELLRKAADAYGTTSSQMKYALSFAGVKKLVKIDYDSATVTAVQEPRVLID